MTTGTTRAAETRTDTSWHKRRMRIPLAAATFATVACALAPRVANAQAIALNTGFQPGARAAQGMSGGPFPGQNVNSTCRGYIGAQPQHVVMTRSGFGFLRMFVVSQGDTTLVVRAQNGMVYCNDDHFGLNPSLDMQGLPPGRYDVFVGSYSQGAQNPYTLYLSENAGATPDTVNGMLMGGGGQMMGGPANNGGNSVYVDPNGNVGNNPNNNPNGSGWGNGTPVNNGNNGMPVARPPQGGSGLRVDLPPTGGRIQIRGPLRRPERRIARIADANSSASGLHGDGTCRGFIAERPSFVVNIASPQPFLRFFLGSAADTTLVVQYPDGHVACSDDSYGSLQPSIEGNFPAGTYYVWAGIYRQGMARPYRLSITADGNEHP